MKTLEFEKMELLQGGSNRQCLIDGILTGIAMGLLGPIGLLGGLYAANSNGCFD